MNKEQQIEEIAKYSCNACEMGFDIDGGCAQGNNYKTCRTSKETAEYIYNAGYRKTFTSDLASNTQKAFKEGYDKGFDEQKAEIERLEAEIERLERVVNDQNELCWGCKKSVREFAEELKGRCHNYYPSIDHYCCSVKAVSVKDINELLKEYDK